MNTMNEDSFNRIKKLMKIIGGKAIIIEDGKPAFVIINADEYLEFEDAKKGIETEAEILNRINRDIEVWKQVRKKEEIARMDSDSEARQARKEEYVIVPQHADI